MPNLALDLRYLNCAAFAAQHGSFRRAAAALGLPQSTVSRRVKLLEHKLGFPLFLRDARGVRLTVAGENFLNEAAAGARQLDRAAQLASELYHAGKGELRIGITAPLAGGFLYRLLRRFREVHPDVRVAYREDTSDEILRVVATGQLDVSFVPGDPRLPGHEARVLCYESLYVVLPKAHRLSPHRPITWHDLRDETFIVCRSGTDADYVATKLASIGADPRVEIHDVSRTSLLDLVAMAYGVAVTSTSASVRDTDRLVYRSVVGERDVLPSSAIWQATNEKQVLHRLLSLARKLAEEPDIRPVPLHGRFVL